jgi:putative ABC transport system substrate-binding protein
MKLTHVALSTVFILGHVAGPLTGDAHQARKVHRIGMLETRSAALNAANVDAFREGLRELGYREGQNIEIVYRSSEGRNDRFPGLARELVNLKVDVIVTRGTPAVQAAKSATATIPVVMAASGAPLGSGIVATLARPGGNVTGLSSGIAMSFPKQLELLAELIPRLRHVVAILNMSNLSLHPAWNNIESSARALGIEPQLLDVRRPEDLRVAFDTAVKARAGAVIVGLDTVTQTSLRSIAGLATERQLPSIYPAKEYAELGGLMTYGASDFHMYHRAAAFVDKIFKGARPADLPVEQPTKFELVINLKTAKVLGLTIPPSQLLRADRVIDP